MKIIDTLRSEIYWQIECERNRQNNLKAQGKFKYTCADPEMTNGARIEVLGEELGEVCRAALNLEKLATDVNPGDLRTELIELCAVAVAWCEALSLPRWYVQAYPDELTRLTGPLWAVIDRNVGKHDVGDLFSDKKKAERQAEIYNTEGKYE